MTHLHPGPAAPRRITAALAALFLLLALAAAPGPPAAGESAPAARAAGAVWHDGDIAYSTVVNCTSIIFGNPRSERGVGAYAGSWGDWRSSTPRAGGLSSWVHVVVYGLGEPCGGTYVSPQLSLPPGVSWDKRLPIGCFYRGQRLSGDECPQWEAMAEGAGTNGSDWYANTRNPWGLVPGASFEFVLPVKASRAVSGRLTAYLRVADGNQSPTLGLAAPVVFFPAKRCLSHDVTVDLAVGQRPTNGPDVILGTSGRDRIRAGGGADVVCGGDGADVLLGGSGADRLAGARGADRLAGGPGRDTCLGGAGRDVARGCERRRR